MYSFIEYIYVIIAITCLLVLGQLEDYFKSLYALFAYNNERFL